MDIPPDYTWRPLSPADIPAMAALAAACSEADGGLPFMATEAMIRERCWSAPPHASIAAFDGRRLVAHTTVHRNRPPGEERAVIMGQVHPGYRRRRLGTFLLEWSVEQASAPFASSDSGG